MFDSGWDKVDVVVSACVTGAIGVVTAAWLAYELWIAPEGSGANIGFGAFVLVIATPAAFWAVVTLVQAGRLPSVGARWRLVAAIAAVLLASPWLGLVASAAR